MLYSTAHCFMFATTSPIHRQANKPATLRKKQPEWLPSQRISQRLTTFFLLATFGLDLGGIGMGGVIYSSGSFFFLFARQLIWTILTHHPDVNSDNIWRLKLVIFLKMNCLIDNE